jgi:hypothetical protein
MARQYALIRTLSFGVRCEYQDLPGTSKLIAHPDTPQVGVMPHDRNNFGPRAGFAGDILGSGAGCRLNF